MKLMFLTSSLNRVASKISSTINGKGMKLAFITTASEPDGDDLWWLEADRQALVDAGFNVQNYTFTGKSKEEIEETLKNTDIITIEGGDDFYLLQKIQESDCANIICELVNQGKIYIGSSAGSIVAGPDIDPLKYLEGSDYKPNGTKALGLVDFVTLPHWNSPKFRERYLEKDNIEYLYNNNHKFILLNDNQYVEVRDDWYRIVE